MTLPPVKAPRPESGFGRAVSENVDNTDNPDESEA